MYTVIVSIYNIEKYLRQCIESILSQSYNDFEVILVDDGSRDSSPDICDEFARADSRVRVIHKENGGLMTTRKAGLEAARGKYICFADGDDFMSSDLLETYAKIHDQYDADIISGGWTVYSDDYTEDFHQRIPCGFYEKGRLKKEVYPRMLSTEPFYSFYVMPSVWSKCFKKELLLPIYKDVPDNISLGEDAAVVYPAILSADSMYVADYTCYRYRQNPNSITHTYDKNLYNKLVPLVQHLRKYNTADEGNFKKQIDEYTVYLLNMARYNEFNYHMSVTYSEQKKNFKQYLENDIFLQPLKNFQPSDLAQKIVFGCMRLRLFLPFYLIAKKHRN